MRMPTPPAPRFLLALLAIFPLRSATAQVPSPAAKATEKTEGPEPAKAARQVVGPAAAYKPFIDLTGRYRLVEQYVPSDEPVASGTIGQFRVRVRETLRDEVDAGRKEANPPAEVVRETTYDERPAEVSSLGVAATSRRYASYRVSTEDPEKSGGLRPLDGLSLWYRPKSNEPPQVLCLSGERGLADREYEIVSHQVFVPGLTWLLPIYPVRVGDTWRVPRKGAQALLGEPELRGDALNGRLVELRRSDEGRTSHAILGISGRVSNQYADTSVNAQVVFTFPTPAPRSPDPTKAAVKQKESSIVDARGVIADLRMGLRAEGILTGPDGQARKRQANQELVVERTPGIAPGAAPINIPKDPPAATEVNSWLTYSDPKGRFRLRHPQDLLPPSRMQTAGPAGGDSVLLVNVRRPESRDLISIAYFAADRAPEALKEVLNDQWKKTPSEILNGEEGWLPEAEWPGMKVFHLEAALKAPSRSNRSPRLHYDAYLVKPAEGVSFLVIATTTRDAVGAYRKEVEQIIRSIRFVERPSS